LLMGTTSPTSFSKEQIQFVFQGAAKHLVHPLSFGHGRLLSIALGSGPLMV
jgi:hypothetical protein